MLNQRNTMYAAPDYNGMPMTQSHRTSWQKFKSWVKERPAISTLIALIVVGGIIAVIVGPVVASQRKHDDEDDGDYSRGVIFKMTFQAQNASQVCDNFTDSNFLADYGTKLQLSIASVLGVDPSQVTIQTIQCGSRTYKLNANPMSGNRRLLQDLSTEGGNTVSIMVTFMVLPPSTGGSGARQSTDKVLEPQEALTQLQSNSFLLQQAMSQALGLPTSSVALVSVVATGDALLDPPSPPAMADSPSPLETSPQAALPMWPQYTMPAAYPPPPIGSSYMPPLYGANTPPPTYGMYGTYGNDNYR